MQFSWSPPVTVRVIAATQFFGIPDAVWDTLTADQQDHITRHQSQGSDAAQLIEYAGRKCYDSYGRGRSSEDYHQHILETGHGSVTEHASISFDIDNVSRGLTHELVRHRAGVAISQRSTRYVNESESAWIHHPLVEAYLRDTEDDNMAEHIEQAIELCRSVYQGVADSLQLWITDTRPGLSVTDARKQARGAARGYLGNALCTGLVWTANIRALRHCLTMRGADPADAEIALLFDPIYVAAVEQCPEYFGDFTIGERKDGLGRTFTPQHRI